MTESDICFLRDQPFISSTLLCTANKISTSKQKECTKKNVTLLGKRLRKELNQISSAADIQTDESQEVTNESSFNRIFDGGNLMKFKISITQLSETKSED